MPSLNGGGAEKVLIDILHNIDFKQYHVDLCLILNQGQLLNDVPKSVNVFYLYSKLIFQRLDLYASKYISSRLESNRIKNKLGDKRYDTIISFLEGDGIKKHQYVTQFGAKNLTWVHIDLYNYHYTKNSFRKGEEEMAYSSMDEILFVSKEARDTFRQLFPNNEKPKKVVYNPIDKESIIKKSKEFIDFNKSKITICSVGRLVEQKSYERLLVLAKKLKDGGYDIDFLILGDGLLYERLLVKSKELEVDKMVHFLGFIKNPYPYIAKADIFINVSQSEGFSLVLCEALCLGKAVVFTETAGPTELLNRGEYGILTKHDDESIYKNVISLIDNQELLFFYEKKALERASIFDLNKMMRDIIECF